MVDTPKSDKPNILFIMADDIGWFNLSCLQPWRHGLQDAQSRPYRQRRSDVHRLLRTAELHRRSRRFYYGTIPDPHRPDQGRITWCHARALKPRTHHRAISQEFGLCHRPFGKNHLGDRNEHLPTVHGFDEFFGNLYHLNAEEEPEYRRLPERPEFPEEVRSARRAEM